MGLRRPRSRLGRASPHAATLVALFLVAANLRPALSSVAALLETIRSDLGLSAAVAGLLSTIPVLCMGLLAPLAAIAAGRFGIERSIGWGVLIICVSMLLRLAGGNAIALFASVLGAGTGIALAGTLLVGFVKDRFPHRVGLVTGIYTVGLTTGATAAAGLTVPLEELIGSWTGALASWAMLAALALVVWRPVSRGAPARPQEPTGALPWRDARAWLVTVFFGVQAISFYSALTWVSPLFESLGRSKFEAGWLLAIMNGGQIVGAILVPWITDRTGSRRGSLVVSLTLSGLGFVLLALVPELAPALLTALLGTAMGGLFAIALTLPADCASDTKAAHGMAGMALGVGYAMGAVGPFAAGALYDATGSFTVPFIALAALQVVMLLTVPALVAAPGRRSLG
ncbi:MAG: MFS transporter [Solirubrobacteraceae bacterium]|nr:MFS transporter [Solirubrobacteraceae bacterium]